MDNEEKIVVDLEATDEIEEENTDSYKYKAPVITEKPPPLIYGNQLKKMKMVFLLVVFGFQIEHAS